MFVPWPLRRLNIFKQLEERTKASFDALDRFIFEAIVSAFVLFTVFWVSVFLYVVFYYSYVPAIEHRSVVHFNFDLEYPSAHVQLTKHNHLLMLGQPYKISLALDMPESPVNLDVGMFMVCAQLTHKGKETLSHSCRPMILRYHSPLLSFMKTAVFAPFLIYGSMEEKQLVEIELMSSFEEDSAYPVTDIYLELRSKNVQIYNAVLRVHAHLTGLRYLMYNFPLISAGFGVSFNVTVILFLVALSWWRISSPYEPSREPQIERREPSTNKKLSPKFVTAPELLTGLKEEPPAVTKAEEMSGSLNYSGSIEEIDPLDESLFGEE